MLIPVKIELQIELYVCHLVIVSLLVIISKLYPQLNLEVGEYLKAVHLSVTKRRRFSQLRRVVKKFMNIKRPPNHIYFNRN